MNRTTSRPNGFATLDPFAVTAILVILTGFLATALNNQRTLAKRVTCATNLKAVGTAFALYAAANEDRLPFSDGSKTLWLSDLPPDTANVLQRVRVTAGMPADTARNLFYCPENTTQDPETLWKDPDVRITGYAFLIARTNNTKLPDLAKIQRPNNAPPSLRYHAKFASEPFPSASELALDWILTPDPTSTNYTIIKRPPTYTFSTSHLKNTQPAGANILCFDAHVEWRLWAPTAAAPLPCEGATFWLPNP